ncbi:MAG: 6-phosphofructokinase [Desulfotomaculum sp.]|nr:6-phosphofructokinase [Desulfotomaculum sp.]
MQRIGILTSGGDASGMNSAIRAVVRKAIYHGIEVVGINRGYSGFIDGDMQSMNLGSVADIIHRGGTILRTARSREFATSEGKTKAYKNAVQAGIQGLIVIGGDGSFRGAADFYEQHQLPVIGVPGTIDNDIFGTDYSIGFDTAVNNVVDAINKIRDTATSHERTFIIEVMGRDCGAIALTAGLAGGAESIIIPEVPFDIKEICAKLMRGVKRGKLHSMIVVAEGAAGGLKVGQDIKTLTGTDTKVTILGHLQRGGSPTVLDRVLAARMGAKAVELLMDGQANKAVGMHCEKIVSYELETVFKNKKELNIDILELAKILSI